jgi:hypothetical protein
MNHFARIFVSCCAVGSIALLSTASAQVPAQIHAKECPTKLDYLVLASMADSPSLMGMSVSRAAEEPENRTPALNQH